MENEVKANVEFLIETLSPVDAVKTNLYLIRALRLIIKDESNWAWWDEAVLELNRVIDVVRVNKCGREVRAMIADFDILLPAADLLEATLHLHRAHSSKGWGKKVKASVLKIQGERAEKALAKLSMKA